MKFFRLAVLLLSMSLFSFLRADPIDVGASAPVVSGTTEAGSTLNFADAYKSGYTLVYFYPKAGTSGCTAQGCSLRDSYETLTKRGVTVIGVSTDDVAAQKKFKDENHFPFTLIADTDKTVINAFGVPTKTVPVMGTLASRQAFLIKDGKVVWRDLKASTKEQANDVINFLDGKPGKSS